MKKIINKVKNVAVVLTGLSIASACADYLDVPVNGLLSESEFYQTDNDALVALSGVYDRLSNTYNHIWASMYLIREIRSDDTNAGGADDRDQAGHQLLDDFKHDASNDQVLACWKNLWTVVYRANKLINKTVADTELKERAVAEAKFIRAYTYMDLVTFWGDVPLVTDDIPVTEFTAIERADKSLIYALIETDLAEAAAVLPESDEYVGSDRFRATKGAAQALLGKALLYQDKFEAAAAAFEDVINSGKYALETEMIWNFSKGTEFGKESLFELQYVNTQQYDWGNYAWGGPTEDNIIIQLMGPRSIDGTPFSAPAGDSISLGWGFCNPTQELYDAFEDAGDVTRRGTTMISKAEFDAAGGVWSPDDWDFENQMRRKYGHYASESGPPVGELNHTTNWRLIRYADVLLMAAEANARRLTGTDETKAKNYLNMVRQRPGNNGELAAVTATGAALFTAIVTERRLELAFEGHRFADLVRWGLADAELPTAFIAGKHELLPIPQQDVDAAGMRQNDGY